MYFIVLFSQRFENVLYCNRTHVTVNMINPFRSVIYLQIYTNTQCDYRPSFSILRTCDPNRLLTSHILENLPHLQKLNFIRMNVKNEIKYPDIIVCEEKIDKKSVKMSITLSCSSTYPSPQASFPIQSIYERNTAVWLFCYLHLLFIKVDQKLEITVELIFFHI